MKQGTTYQKLGDVCDVINGLWKGKKPPYKNVGVIRNANFTKSFTLRYDNIEYLDVEVRQFEKRKLQKGDLIVERSGGSEKQPVGRAVLFEREDGEFSFSNFTSILRIKDKDSFNSKFLFYFLLFIYKRGDTLGMQKATTGIHNIEFEKYLNISVPAISIAEQERIVERLDAAFAQIDELKSNAEKQFAEAHALFQASLNEMLEPKERWEVFKLCEVVNIINGYAFPSKAFGDNQELKVVKITNVGVGSFLEDSSTLPQDMFIQEVCVKEDDIVIALTRTIISEGLKRAKVPYTYNGAMLNQRVASLRYNGKINMSFLYYYLGSPFVSDYVWSHVNTLMQPNLSIRDLRDLPVSMPPFSEQQIIVATLDSLRSKVDHLQENFKKISQECDALKQALLRQIFE